MQKYELAKFESSSIHNNLFYIHQHKRNFNKHLHSDYLNNNLTTSTIKWKALENIIQHLHMQLLINCDILEQPCPSKLERRLKLFLKLWPIVILITTKTYVNIPMAVGKIAYRFLNNGVNHKVSVNVDIIVLINVLR